jgi:hypothetical protein
VYWLTIRALEVGILGSVKGWEEGQVNGGVVYLKGLLEDLIPVCVLGEKVETAFHLVHIGLDNEGGGWGWRWRSWR